MKKVGLLIFCILLVLTGCSEKQIKEPTLEEGFDKNISEMEKMVEYLHQKETEKGIESFHTAHDFFHEIDPFLRRENPELAENIWNSVLMIEEELEMNQENPSNELLLKYGEMSLNYLKESKEVLIN